MALPDAEDISTLDFVLNAQPLVAFQAGTGVDTNGLDFALNGGSFWAQAGTEADTTLASEVTVGVSAYGFLAMDMFAQASLVVDVPLAGLEVGTQLGEDEDTPVTIAADGVLSLGIELAADASILVSVADTSLETGISLSADPLSLSVDAAGSLVVVHTLASEVSIGVSSQAYLLLGQELAAGAVVSVTARGSLIVYPETATGFLLLF